MPNNKIQQNALLVRLALLRRGLFQSTKTYEGTGKYLLLLLQKK